MANAPKKLRLVTVNSIANEVVVSCVCDASGCLLKKGCSSNHLDIAVHGFDTKCYEIMQLQ